MEIQNELDIFLANYGAVEPAQKNQEAISDSQIKNLSLSLAEAIKSSSQGTVVDIGCGNGILLRRLSEISSFSGNDNWYYLGADFPEKHKEIINLAFELALHRRVDILDLDQLYSAWISPENTQSPLIVFIRNVFHELDIDYTAKLIHVLCSNLQADDKLFIQDLLVFPKAERGNACWLLSSFTNLFSSCGFDYVYVEEPTSKGNRWFSLIATKLKENSKFTYDAIKNTVIKERKNQYDFWHQNETTIPAYFNRQNNKVALVDFDLQMASLQRQLINANAIGIEKFSKDKERRVSIEVFEKHLLSYDPALLEKRFSPFERPPHFRDRGNSQDALEDFIISDQQVCIICGGPFMGKTDLIAEVLYRRSHSRQAVHLDTQFTSSVWNLLEQYFSNIGCYLPHDLLSGFTSVSFNDLLPPLTSLINKIGKKTIIAFDHFERLLDPNGEIQDSEIVEFIKIISSAPHAKIIVTSRRNPYLTFLQSDIAIDTAQPPVGRFPEGEHVENVLDDFIDRATLGLSSYPDELLQAIDRIPYLTTLAAKIIKKGGPSSITNPTFLKLLHNRLREELLQRVLTDLGRPAINITSFLRIPVPRAMLERLAGKESVNEAEELGLIYRIFHRHGGDLLTGVSTLRFRTDDADESEEIPLDVERISRKTDQQHYEIAKYYKQLYREDDNPIWIREAYYHSVASGDTNVLSQFGALYKGELFWAGEYWFRKRKNYDSALEAFKAAKSLGLHTYRTDLRMAACLMRCNYIPNGEKLYHDLFDNYPNARGAKTSYIDSLLYLNRYKDALDRLSEFGFTIHDSVWIAHQYGRCYFGLRYYKESLNAFKFALKNRGEPIDYYSVARSYHRLGEQDNVGTYLVNGLHYFKNNFRLKLSYAAHLIQIGGYEYWEKAESILKDLIELSPFHGGVLQQMCKLLCADGRVKESEQLVKNKLSLIRPERYKIPIQTEILLGQNKWHHAIRILQNISKEDEHLVGLKKKAYLRWACDKDSPKNQKEIACKGLQVEMADFLKSNIPILVTSARLAHICQDDKTFSDIIALIRNINNDIAENLITENSEICYWEDDSFSY